MKIDAISNKSNTNFRGIGSKIGKVLEGAAATLPTKTNKNRKTISIELHNAMVKLTAYRVAILFTTLSGFLGFKAADKMSDNNTEDFANAIENAGIDTNAPFEIKDANHDGSADIILQKTDGSKIILDCKNTNVLMEQTGFKEIE